METESSDLRAGGGAQHPGSMRATKLPLRPTLLVVLFSQGVQPAYPKPPSAKRPKSLWNAPALSLYLQVSKKEKSQSPPGLGRVKGQENSKEAEGYRAFESKSLL